MEFDGKKVKKLLSLAESKYKLRGLPQLHKWAEHFHDPSKSQIAEQIYRLVSFRTRFPKGAIFDFGELENEIFPVDKQRLEELAKDFCSVFLTSSNGSPGTNGYGSIGLNGDKKIVLLTLKEYMDNYFEERGNSVQVGLSNQGYCIDVGDFLKDRESINTALQEV